jgi:hypothetical protein
MVSAFDALRWGRIAEHVVVVIATNALARHAELFRHVDRRGILREDDGDDAVDAQFLEAVV